MLLWIALGGIWVLLCCDAYVVTHRKSNQKAKPLDTEEEHDLLYTSPYEWVERAVRAVKKGTRHEK